MTGVFIKRENVDANMHTREHQVKTEAEIRVMLL